MGRTSTTLEPRTGDEAVRQATGRKRDEWFALLDRWGGTTQQHREIAAWLMREHGVGSWWAQTLTVHYERARGLRPPGGSRDGTFTVNASTTVGVPVKRLFKAFIDERLRSRWLPGAPMRERRSQPERSARFDWKDDATRVNVGFVAKGEARSQAALSHERLPDAEAARKARAYWRGRMTALKALLERRPVR